MDIYVNGNLTSYINIFDLLETKDICPWEYASSSLIGRNLTQVLDEWVQDHKTYYYINRKRYDFELK